MVKIDVTDTALEDVTIAFQMIKASDEDWYGYRLDDALFVGCGDPSKLETLLLLFRQLVEQGPSSIGAGR
jgi:hypothetical protein